MPLIKPRVYIHNPEFLYKGRTVIERLKQFREENAYTNRRTSELLGLHKDTLGRITTDKNYLEEMVVRKLYDGLLALSY